MIIMILLAVEGVWGTPPEALDPRPNWRKITQAGVDFNTEWQEVNIPGAHLYSALKFKVLKEPMDLVSVTIVYNTGEDQSINIIFHVKAPGESREFAIDGSQRRVKKIVLLYQALPNQHNKTGHIEIWGLRVDPPKKK